MFLKYSWFFISSKVCSIDFWFLGFYWNSNSANIFNFHTASIKIQRNTLYIKVHCSGNQFIHHSLCHDLLLNKKTENKVTIRDEGYIKSFQIRLTTNILCIFFTLIFYFFTKETTTTNEVFQKKSWYKSNYKHWNILFDLPLRISFFILGIPIKLSPNFKSYLRFFVRFSNIYHQMVQLRFLQIVQNTSL